MIGGKKTTWHQDINFTNLISHMDFAIQIVFIIMKVKKNSKFSGIRKCHQVLF